MKFVCAEPEDKDNVHVIEGFDSTHAEVLTSLMLHSNQTLEENPVIPHCAIVYPS